MSEVVSFEEMLEEWTALTQQLVVSERRELILRNALAAAAFPMPKQGTNTLVLADGRKFKYVHRENTSILSADLKEVLALLPGLTNQPVETFLDVAYSYSKAKTDAAPDAVQQMIKDHLTTKTAAVKIEVV